MTTEITTDGIFDAQAIADVLSKSIRPLVRASQPVLFHGTRYPKQVLREDRLLYPMSGTQSVHFTRSLPMATYWALLDRRDDEGIGAVFVLDRDRLAQDYSVRCHNDFPDPVFPSHKCSEADELIYLRDVVGLHKYLIDTVWIDEKLQVVRSANRARAEREQSRCRRKLPGSRRRVPGSGQQAPAVAPFPSVRRSPRLARFASMNGAARSAATNVRTLFRDLEGPALRDVVLREIDAAARTAAIIAERERGAGGQHQADSLPEPRRVPDGASAEECVSAERLAA
jgi:hypothetical protein